MKLKQTIAGIIAVSVLSTMLYGCQEPEGPVERAGKEVDQAAEKAGEKIEKVGEDIQDAAEGDKK